MSGQELPAVSMKDISDVRDLKAPLQNQHDFLMCMQQLLHNGNSLEDSTELDAPIDLQLALVALSSQCSRLMLQRSFASLALSDQQVARLLLEAGAENELQNRDGYTALRLTAQNGHVEMARLLLDAGADKDFQDYDG